YLAFLSPSLDDWDSVNFLRAISYFDMRLQQPHPPGYPAYVFLARVINFFTHDPHAALTVLSAISGALCVLAFAHLASRFGAGLGCCLVWAIALAASVDWQLAELWRPVKKQLDYVRVEDSLVGQPITHDSLLQRLSDYGSVFSGYFGGPFSGYFGFQMEGGF